jgi:hypothetical protein
MGNSNLLRGTFVKQFTKFGLLFLCLALSTVPAIAEDTPWHTQPISYVTLGSEVNSFYHVVGLPKDCICQFMSKQPAYSANGHDFFHISGHPDIFMELEFSDDGLSIRRFRFIEKSANSLSENKFGGWQTENVRRSPNDFTTGVSIVQLSRTQDPFVMPFASMPFSFETWNNDQQRRRWLLFDIAHNHPIVGMLRSELVAVLGSADSVPNLELDANSKFEYFDKYILSYGCLGVYSVLEIAYKDDQAVAFRVSDTEPPQRGTFAGMRIRQ